MPHPAPLRLLPPAEPARSAPPHPRLARGGERCRVLTLAKMMDAIGEPRLATASVTFDRFTAFDASGTAVEAGVSYEFDVFEDGGVRLWRDDRRVPAGHKAPLCATIAAVFRVERSERALAALSASVDRAVAEARP